MILQGIYWFVRNDSRLAYFEDHDGQTVSIRLSDWVEMGRPERVSVTVMKLLVRT